MQLKSYQQNCIRSCIAQHLADTPGPVSARDIAAACGIGYKTTIDALNSMLNMERVARQGSKSGSRWLGIALAQPSPPARVEDFWGRRA